MTSASEMQNADDSVETVIVVSEKNNGEDSEEPGILDLSLPVLGSTREERMAALERLHPEGDITNTLEERMASFERLHPEGDITNTLEERMAVFERLHPEGDITNTREERMAAFERLHPVAAEGHHFSAEGLPSLVSEGQISNLLM